MPSAIELGEPTASVAERVEELAAWAMGEGGREEAEYWAEVERARAWVPVSDEGRANVEGAVERARRRVSAEATRLVVAGGGAGRGAGAGEMVAGGLGVALCEWSGCEEMAVEVEGHGREEFSGLDVSGTVGWLTALYPVRLRGGEVGEALRWAKEWLRGVPRGGAGYGALRYLGGVEKLRGERVVSLNYFGQFGEVGGRLWGWAEEGAGRWRWSGGERRYELEVEARVLESGEMEVVCGYARGRQRAEEMEELVERMVEAVEAMARGRGSEAATPSDFPDAELSQAELDDLLIEFS
jgi:non-ribosomal peptide synthase protein (TIGR01720 family)